MWVLIDEEEGIRINFDLVARYYYLEETNETYFISMDDKETIAIQGDICADIDSLLNVKVRR
jgi:hypothetical protein